MEWGKGLAQKREAEARAQELELEKDKPFARTRLAVKYAYRHCQYFLSVMVGNVHVCIHSNVTYSLKLMQVCFFRALMNLYNL